METFYTLVEWFRNNPDMLAITVGMLNSWGMTQFIKYQLVGWPVDHVKLTRLTAFIIGLVTVTSLWVIAVPGGHWMWGLQWGMVVGSLSPLVYKITFGVLYHFFPGLEKFVSADPKIRVKYDEHGNIGVKLDDDETKYFSRDTTQPRLDNQDADK